MFKVKTKRKVEQARKRHIIEEEDGEDSSSTSDKEIILKEKEKIKTKKSEINQILSKKNEVKLFRIVLENFKSFKGRHEIGNFLNFSVVLGPNGSGKSNIIDAICFALGMKTITLRTKNLKDLIYKKDSDEENSNKNCFVELFFLNEGDEISVKRTITSKGGSEFFYKNNKVGYDEFCRQLEAMDIPSKARYYILVQGAIDTILSKKNDLTDTIEHLSGSYKFKEAYEKAKMDVENYTNEINKLSTEMNSIKDDRNKVKTQIENETKYNEFVTKITETLNKVYLHRLAEIDITIKNNEDNLVENEESMKLTQDNKNAIIEFIKSNEIQIRKSESEFKVVDYDVDNLKNIAEDLKNKILQCSENIKLQEGQIFSKISLLNQHKIQKKKNDEKKMILHKQISAMEKEIIEITNKINFQGDSINKNLNKEQIDEYRRISSQVEVETFSLNKEMEKIQIQIAEALNQKNMIEKNLNNFESEKASIEKELKIFIEKKENEENSIKNLEIEIKKIKLSLSEKENEKIKDEADYDQICKRLNEKLVQLSHSETDNYESSKRRKISELINKNPNVHGFLYELITPLQKKLELPIKVSLLKYLNYLVVDKQETAKICSEFLKNKELNADVLVLENIPEKESDESVRLQLGNLGNLAVDLIDCKVKGLKNAINYFLKDLVLCYDKENIFKIKSKGFNSIILLDGTVYRKGTITGGNYKNLEQFSFNYNSSSSEEIEKIRKEVEFLTKQIQILNEKKSDFKEINSLRNILIEKENLLEVHTKNLSLSSDNIKKSNSYLSEKERNLIQTSNALEVIQNSHKDLLQKMENLVNKVNDLRGKLFSDFMIKNKLSSLNDFEPYSLSQIKRLSEQLKVNEEKLVKMNSQIKILESSDELISKLENSLNQVKIQKGQFEKEKDNLVFEYEAAVKHYEKEKESKNGEYQIINQIKESIKTKQIELDKIEKRIRDLLKNKIEYEHNIISSIDNKRLIIEESKVNMDSYIKDLVDLNKNLSIFFSFDVNIEKFIIANERKFGKTDLVIDYSSIETKTKIIERSIEGHKEKVEKCKNKFSGLMKELEKYVKLCALNQSEANILKDKEEELAKKKKDLFFQVQTWITDLDEKKEEFEKIKRERKKKFTSFFETLSTKLTAIYKELTTPQNSLSPGGSAFIYNTNEDEPYIGTICYLPTPPGKRVIYDIDQLSGGEKTIAILSLVISLQSISETPFVILDEIDSYLDLEHELILENLFKSHNKNFQIILVTHKPNIFRSAEALIGTYFNKLKFSSIPISVDMTKIY